MKKEQRFAKISELKARITELIRQNSINGFPQTLVFNERAGLPRYKITIDAIQEDFFIDEKGTKWMKVKE